MKTTIVKNRREQGNFLVMALIITAIAGFVLASFLTLAATQSRSITRSQIWNASIPVTEAGIEEALTHLNDNCVSNDITGRSPNWTADGWTSSGGTYSKTTYLPDGSYYAVTILTDLPNTWAHPAILSTGNVPAPTVVMPVDTMFAVVGDATPDPTYNNESTRLSLARKVKVIANLDAIFARGMVAKEWIDLHGNNVSSDSFDSSNPAFSNNGQYDPNPLRTRDNGDIASNSSLTNSISGGNANIAGHVSTGPNGSVAIGANGTVGDKAWVAANMHGIQPGHIADDMNVNFPDVKIPFTGGDIPVGGPLTITNGQVTASNTVTHGPFVSYPVDATGPVTTNTTTVTQDSYPAAGTYQGFPITNTVSTTTAAYPSSGTYVGAVATNHQSATSATYPTAGTYVGTPGTNSVPTISSNYPSAGTYVGTVSTNTAPLTSSTIPSSGAVLSGTITTNCVSTTTATLPASGYIGAVTTNTTATTSSSSPSAGTYLGSITPVTTATTSSSYPSEGTYVGSVTPITTLTTSSSAPAAGTYVGTVTTLCSQTLSSDKNFPAAGTYCGTPYQTGNSQNNNSAWNWYKITGYSYNKITGYSYDKITGYSYNQISSYTYCLINSYTYTGLTGYSYALITGYTYEQITGYTYSLITGYTFARIDSYTWYNTVFTTNVVTITYDIVLDTGKYKVDNLNGNVLVRGQATLLADNVQITGNNGITINAGAVLKMYVTGASSKIAGNGVINKAGYATNFFYYGLPSNTTLDLSGNGLFIGVVYAPEADYALNGGGHDTTDFIGASVSRTVRMNGHFNFHYDESLGRFGPSRGYLVQSWNEIPLSQNQ